ncbi:MAG TPA: S8 family serine peptidase [Gaiellaceae bacterium]|nr:S8 family serine peptidase [Gaiellaceae bacterium]
MGLRIIASVVPLLLALGATAANAQPLPQANDWQSAELSLPQAWQLTQGSASAVVAIVDTGVQADHPSLAGRVLPGWNLIAGNSDTSDDNGHGTALAGIVAATCPGCKILPVKVLGADLTGTWTAVAAGITWAADHGAQVINLSLGSPRTLDSVDAAVAYALAKGVIVVAAAGNDGRNESFYPAMDPGVVSVAGIDQNGARYPWSNFGNWVTVAAPGCTSTAWIGGGSTSDFCGTSTAAPFVSGVAGLARSLQPALTPAQFAGALSSSDPLTDSSTATLGVVDAGRLLAAIAPRRTAPVASHRPVVTVSPYVGRRVTARAGVWQDAVSYTVRWQRSFDGTHWQLVGAGAAYTPRRADLAARLRVIVTASNATGSATLASAPTTPVRK